MSNDKDMLAEKKSTEQALDYAVRRENSLENQLHIRKQGRSGIISGNTNIKSEPAIVSKKRKEHISITRRTWSGSNLRKKRLR